MTSFADVLVKSGRTLVGSALLVGVTALAGFATTPARGADPTPTTIKRLDTPLFGALDQRGGVFKFDGSLMSFRIELEADGKTSALFEDGSKNLKAQADNAARAGKATLSSGHLVWVVRFQDGKEVWDFAATVTDADGKVKASFRALGFSPPKAGASKARLTEVGGPSDSLRVDKETTLFTIETTDEAGKVIRTARLKVGPAK